MSNYHHPIVVDEDDDIELLQNSHHRSSSIVSSASSHTMRAESEEVKVIARMASMSVQPSAASQSSRPTISPAPRQKRRRPSEPHIEQRSRPYAFTSNRERLALRSRNVDPSPKFEDKAGRRPNSNPRVSEEHRNVSVSQNGQSHRNAIITDDVAIPRFNPAEHNLIEIEDSDEEVWENIEDFREPELPRGRKSNRPLAPQRNPPNVAPFKKIDGFQWGGCSIRGGETVELADGRFLNVTTIIRNTLTGKVHLRGWPLQRATLLPKHMRYLERKINELCYVFEKDQDDPRTVWEQNVVDVASTEIIAVRKLIQTNDPYPYHCFDIGNVPSKYFHRDDTIIDIPFNNYVRANEVLVVRWTLITVFATARERLANPAKPTVTKPDNGSNFIERRLETLSEEKCSRGYYTDPSVLRFQARGPTKLGGSGTRLKASGRKPPRNPRLPKIGDSLETAIKVSDDENEDESNKENSTSRHRVKRLPLTERVYTFADVCSGGGGSLRGAILARLKAIWGLDFDPNACATLRANWPELEVFEMEAQKLTSLTDSTKQLIVDILHISPPCQVFSNAHTHEGKNDEMNYAALFMIKEIVKIVKPRIVTLEQTSGIMKPQWREALNQVFQALTSLGYSFSMRVEQLLDFGLAQSRRRLLIVAAGPGDTIPDFPAQTHNKNGTNGKKKYASVRSVLDNIHLNAPNNEIPRSNKQYPTWDASTYATCICTSGDQKYPGHPDGRPWTLREFAALQSFPDYHIFLAPGIKRQIGNAVPPMIAKKILFDPARMHLERSDAAEERRNRRL